MTIVSVAVDPRRLVSACGGPAAFAGLCLAFTLVGIALFAPMIAPYDPRQVDVLNRLSEPSPEHWFGTDQSGRDVLSRVIFGTRVSLEVAGLAVIIGLIGGVTLGLTAGFFHGGWPEQLLMRSLDAIASIPLLIWAIALVGVLGTNEIAIGPFVFGNEIKLLTLLGLLYIPTLARVTYTSAAVESRATYVAARRLQGAGSIRIMLSDVLPNCLSPIIVQATLLLAVGIVVEATISFVGLGVQPPRPSWGNMLAEARNYLLSGEWWLSIYPGMAIAVTVIAFNLLGDGLRDILDPRHDTRMLSG